MSDQPKANSNEPIPEPIDLIEKAQRANCPACQAQRLHTDEERKHHHPHAGHGRTREQGATIDYNTGAVLVKSHVPT